MLKPFSSRGLRWVALFLVGLFTQILLNFPSLEPTLAQVSLTPSSCTAVIVPLTPEEDGYARTAWKYFLNNFQATTGFVNAADRYPSASLWDLSNYLMALNAVRGLGIIDQADFDYRLNLFLKSLSSLPLFEEKLPNKAYNTATGQMVNYNNEPEPRGIGWSALDLGRTLAALHAIRTCHPEYNGWISSIVDQWKVEQSVQNSQMYGAMVSSNNRTTLVQEGRLGYEEYAARGYQLWGFNTQRALDLQPLNYVEIDGVQVPVDQRDYQSSGANNYVVSESYILDGIEFGLQGILADHAAKVFEVQKRHYEATQELTAVSEDNINQPPYFLYNTVYANGASWATITDQNQPFPQLRTLSTKAAFGWHYLYPNSPYGQQLLEAVKSLYSPDGGYYAGRYQVTQQPNDILTANTNGLILEILYFKARGNRPIVGDAIASSSRAIAPIPPVNNPTTVACPLTNPALNPTEQQSAATAWTYFRANVESTGLVSDRNDIKGVTLWGVGDYINALHAARSLEVIAGDEFDQRTRQLLGALQVLPLSQSQLPYRSYDPRSLQPIDYGGNAISAETGWSSLDLGRLLAALYTLKTCHPQYGEAIDGILLNWSYASVIQNRQLISARLASDSGETLQTTPETRLGYAEYAARAFQLWGFNTSQSEVNDAYQTAQVEGIAVPVARLQANGTPLSNPYTIADPFVLYGLEFGLDPQMRSLIQPILQAEASRHQRTGKFSASGTTLINQAPYVIHNTVIANETPWATLTDQGQTVPNQRLVSTAIAFGYHALFPDHPYAQALWQSVVAQSQSSLGYFEGYLESNGETPSGFTSSTNSTVLQALLYQANQHQPLVRANPDRNSPWWQAIARGDHPELPQALDQPIHLVVDNSGAYWTSQAIASAPTSAVISSPTVATAPSPSVTPPDEPLMNRLEESDRIAAQRAWAYFARNWNSTTGMVNAVDNLEWTTLWDQGSAILGIHTGRQLGLVSAQEFQSRIGKLLHTLETLPLPATGLPNKAYSTATAEMRRLDNTPDAAGISGWSVLDTARLLVGLDVLRTHYPEYGDRITGIVARWNLSKLVKDGWLQGGISTSNGRIQDVQEGRLGYEQYAAFALQRWGVTAEKALNESPTATVEVEGISLQVDRRNFQNSGASNYLTSDPYVLWGVELGLLNTTQTQVEHLLLAQQKRYERTQILTAVNEDSLDRAPYFLYYSVYADDQPWQVANVRGQPFPELRFLSTKAAFGWAALMPENSYAKLLRDSVQNLADTSRGYFSGRYENSQLGANRSVDINTNAIVLESLLYIARDHHPLTAS